MGRTGTCSATATLLWSFVFQEADYCARCEPIERRHQFRSPISALKYDKEPTWKISVLFRSALLAGALLATGLVAGIIAGLLGVGGGIVIVPVLYYMFTALKIDPAILMHVAVGTSLATIFATGTSSARAHYNRGSVDMDLLKRWWWAIAIGVISGAMIAGNMSGGALTLVFGVVALLVSANMMLRKEGSASCRQTAGISNQGTAWIPDWWYLGDDGYWWRDPRSSDIDIVQLSDPQGRRDRGCHWPHHRGAWYTDVDLFWLGCGRSSPLVARLCKPDRVLPDHTRVNLRRAAWGRKLRMRLIPPNSN
jgi:hypothetical protein